jgi:Peptidase family M28
MMTALRCIALCLLALTTATLANAAGPAALDALLLDSRAIAPAQRLSLIEQAQSRGGWWLGLEQQLLIAAPAPLIAKWRVKLPVQRFFRDAQDSAFSLQSMACDERDSKIALPAIAKAGRGNLVLTPRNFLGLAVNNGLYPIRINQQIVSSVQLSRSKAADRNVQAILDRIQPARWFADLSQLATWKRNSYGTEIDSARDWLAAQFSNLGLTVTTPTFNVGSAAVQIENVVGTLTGTSLPDEWIVIGAHYDSRNVSVSNTSNPSPGAEDNASGCAGVLELARVLHDLRPKRSIKFMCFGGEEQNLYGSEAYAASLVSSGELAKLKLVVIMDMIGYSSTTALDVLLETSSALSAVLPPFQQAAADYVPNMTVTTSLSPFGSDHMPFINRGVPTLLLIENEWDSYPHYHKATDLPANVSNALLEGPAILRMLLAVVATRSEIDLALFANGFE